MTGKAGSFRLKVLALNIGGATQEAFLWGGRSAKPYKFVMPSPTVMLARRIGKLTGEGKDIVLLGDTMGGGAIKHALLSHLDAALNVYATPESALTFSYDPAAVKKAGIRVVPVEEAMSICSGSWAQGILTRDVDRDALSTVFSMYGLHLSPETVAVGVEDHGWRETGKRCGACRFDVLKKSLPLRAKDIAYENPPEIFPRMCGVKRTLARDFSGARHVIMDSKMAAIFGALPATGAGDCLVADIGHDHMTAAAVRGGTVTGLLECHVRDTPTRRLAAIIRGFCAGKTNFPEIHGGDGHGACIPGPFEPARVIATGSGRSMLSRGGLKAEYPSPFGDAGLSAVAGLVETAVGRFRK